MELATCGWNRRTLVIKKYFCVYYYFFIILQPLNVL